MLAKSLRFHGHNTVRRVYRQGRSVRNGLGSLHIMTDPVHPRTRVAVVVSRKVNKSAVARNRIRRRIYEMVRNRLPSLSQPAELVLTVYKAEAEVLPQSQLEALLDDLLKKVEITGKSST
jgi:ribonuclease P protein component